MFHVCPSLRIGDREVCGDRKLEIDWREKGSRKWDHDSRERDNLNGEPWLLRTRCPLELYEKMLEGAR